MFRRLEALGEGISNKFKFLPPPKRRPKSVLATLVRDIRQERVLLPLFELQNINILKEWGAIDLMGQLRQELKDKGDPFAHLTYVRDHPYCGLILSWDLMKDSAVSTGWKSRQISLHSRISPGLHFEAGGDFTVLTSSNLPLSAEEHNRLSKGRVIVSLIGSEGELQPLERSELFLQHLQENFAGEMAKSGVGVERFAREATLLKMPLKEQAELAMRLSGYGADSRNIVQPQ